MPSPDPPRPTQSADAPQSHREYEDPVTADPGASSVEPLHAILDDPDRFEQRADELRRHRSGFPDRGRPVASLLDALTWFLKLRAEATTLEANAKARRPMGEVAEEEERLVADEFERARVALPDFERGLRGLRSARPDEVIFDSRDPEQDRIAGALIAYLVSTDFATVQTEDLPGERYRYRIGVDWDRLDDFAARLGLPTP